MLNEDELEEFKTEAGELLDEAERSLLSLDKGGSFSAHYAAIFRAFHSIKGAASMMKLDRLQSHMHLLENLLTDQKDKPYLGKPYIDLFLRGSDAARKILGGRDVAFNYDLPEIAVENPKVHPKPSAKESDSAAVPFAGRALIVDDEPDIVSSLEAILRSANVDTRGTTQPETVLDLIDQFSPDAVLSDVAMPNLDGLQLLQRIAQLHPHLPVIFISGHVNKDVLMEAIEIGVFNVIEKPFNAREVIASSINAIRKHKVLKLLDRSVNLLMYQFSDLDSFLKSQGKDDVRTTIYQELKNLLLQKRNLKTSKKMSP